MSSKSVGSVGIGGGGFEVSAPAGIGGGDGLRRWGSAGPGPGTLSGPERRGGGRASGMRTALEWALSAGESTNALPAAFRINVCQKGILLAIKHGIEFD